MSLPGGREATLLAFDYGEKRIGVAVGNSLTRSARAARHRAESQPRISFRGSRQADCRVEAGRARGRLR